jgi:hypothetical protein
LRGAEGVTFSAHYVYYSDLFWLHTGQVYPVVDAISVDAIKRYNGGDWLSTRQPTLEGSTLVEWVRRASHIYVTEFEGEWFRPVYVGGPALSGADEPLVRFGHGEIGLTQARANFSPQRGMVTVLTRWRVDAPSAVKPGVYVFCDGRFIAQRDGAVWGETYPFSAWRPGEAQTDLREIRLSGPVTKACLQVFTAVYQEADGVRWPAFDASSGEGFYDNLVPIPLTTASDTLYPFGN